MLQIFLFPLSFVRRTDVCASDRRTKFAFGRHSSVLLLPSDRARRDGGGDVSMNFANYLAISPTFCSNFSFYNKVFYYGKSQFTKTFFNKSNFVPLLTGKGYPHPHPSLLLFPQGLFFAIHPLLFYTVCLRRGICRPLQEVSRKKYRIYGRNSC